MFSSFSALLFTAHSLAAPLSPRQQADAPFSVPASTLSSSITCPNGISGARGGVVLLVHGTGSTGKDTWSLTPYYITLPTDPNGDGYDVCWVTLPDFSLGDAQVSAEYVAYNVPQLAKQSSTGKVSIIGHSQGAGLNPQWALEFWPSIRPYVSAYVALAPDFHGTAEGLLLCTGQDIAEGGCEPSVHQQSVGSNYLAAQNALGGEALVPTTSIFTIFDDIIQPENPPASATSQLPGASVVYLQQADYCGPLHLADHFTMLVDGGAYALAVDALTHGGMGDPTRLNALTACANLTGFEQTPALLASALEAAINVGADVPRTLLEPPLKQYVCDAGAATNCGAASVPNPN